LALGQTGALRQPHFVHKSLLAAKIGLDAGATSFVETGTYVGMSLYKISGLFEELWSVEADPFLHSAAEALFKYRNVENIHLSCGDSRVFLEELPDRAFESGIFFLDAHYSTGITSRRFGSCPVIDELETIFRRASRAVVVVDDLRTMRGRGGYPDIPTLLNSIPANFKVEIMLDQLVARPIEKL
jgi:hypothetical protein